MLREFIITIRVLAQVGADLNKFDATVNRLIEFEHDQEKIDKMYEQATSSTEKLAQAQS